ncbi:WD40 repeat-like protein [Aulographum hederae CBS 113979]|uniref:WD40 repeat-like protein n=1 Tax=Aulographum hederae CBS 113979 TaxID=1176131 RepID=A0A6G1GVC1_9PEZI|nr:WD40 repeat-like protein [Aulographum hederae CBS 113979]
MPARRPLPPSQFVRQISSLALTDYSETPPPHRSVASSQPSSFTIRSISWSPLGAWVATGASNGTLRCWNPEKPMVRNSTELKGHVGSVEAVAFNPAMEAELASVGADGKVRFWDVRSKSKIGEVSVGGEGLTLTWMSRGEGVLVGRKDDNLVSIDRATLTASEPVKQAVQTNEAQFIPDNTLVFLTAGDGRCSINTFPSFDCLYSFQAHYSACVCLDRSPLGRHLAIGGSDGLVSIWDTKMWACIRTCSVEGAVKTVKFSFCGGYLAAGTDDGNVVDIFHVDSGELVHEVTGVTNPCSVAWHPHKYSLAISSESPTMLKILGGMEK